MNNEEQTLEMNTNDGLFLEPTNMFRIDICGQRNGGQLQQLWCDKLRQKGEWRPVPVVYSGDLSYNGGE